LTAVLLAVFFAGTAAAQTTSTSVIAGVISDANGAPLSDVAITITNRATGAQSIVRSTRAGRFRSGLLSPGSYDLLIERLGYQPERLEGVLLTPGDRRQVDYSLAATGGMVDSVTVRRSAAFSAGPLQRWLLEAGSLPK